MVKKVSGDVLLSGSGRHIAQLDNWLKESADHMKEGLYEQALEFCNAAIEYDSNCSAAWNNRAVCLKNMSRLEDALYAINRALKIEPNNPDYFFNKGNIVGKMGRLGEAKILHMRAERLRKIRKPFK